MLQNERLLGKIGADTAENERYFAEICQKKTRQAVLRRHADGGAPPRSLRSPSSAPRPGQEIRNPVVIIVQRRTFRTNLGGLVLGCIEANSLQGNTYCGAFVEIHKAYALLHVWNPIWKPLKERLQSVIRSKLKSFPTCENLVDELLAE